MRKTLALFLASLFFLAAIGICRASGIDDDHLIVPGKRVGPIWLGKPISPDVLKTFGKPTSYTPPTLGKDGKDSGNYYWEGRINVKLNDGRKDENVYQVYVEGSRYRTAKGIGINSSAAQVKKAYPLSMPRTPNRRWI